MSERENMRVNALMNGFILTGDMNVMARGNVVDSQTVHKRRKPEGAQCL